MSPEQLAIVQDTAKYIYEARHADWPPHLGRVPMWDECAGKSGPQRNIRNTARVLLGYLVALRWWS